MISSMVNDWIVLFDLQLGQPLQVSVELRNKRGTPYSPEILNWSFTIRYFYIITRTLPEEPMVLWLPS